MELGQIENKLHNEAKNMQESLHNQPFFRIYIRYILKFNHLFAQHWPSSS